MCAGTAIDAGLARVWPQNGGNSFLSFNGDIIEATLPNRTLITPQENSMRRMLVFAGILSALCGSGYAQSKDRPSAGAEQAVMRIERELLSAVLKGDPSASERYLADTYVFT